MAIPNIRGISLPRQTPTYTGLDRDEIQNPRLGATSPGAGGDAGHFREAALILNYSRYNCAQYKNKKNMTNLWVYLNLTEMPESIE